MSVSQVLPSSQYLVYMCQLLHFAFSCQQMVWQTWRLMVNLLCLDEKQFCIQFLKLKLLFKVIINNHIISPKDNLKHVGVLDDNKLSWTPHVKR